MKLQGKRIACLVHEDFEDLELWYPVIRCREEGATVDLVGEKAGAVYHGVDATELLNREIHDTVKVIVVLVGSGDPNSAKFFRKRLTATSTYGDQEEADSVSFQAALDLIASRQIDVSPLLSHIYPVDEINTAFEVANEPTDAGALKVSLSF